MARNPQLEAVLAARYAWENSSRVERAGQLRNYHRLLDEALQQAGFRGVTRKQLEDAVTEAYRDFRRAKQQEERARLSRIR